MNLSSNDQFDLFPQTYDPKEIGFITRHRVMTRYFDDRIVIFSEDDEDEISLDARIKEEAIKTIERDKVFLHFGNLECVKQCKYRIEVNGLNEAGFRAVQCVDLSLCCDSNGYFNEEATIRYWRERISYLLLPHIENNLYYEKRDSNTWINEDWAKPIKFVLDNYRCGIKTTKSGLCDYENTIDIWYKYLADCDWRRTDDFSRTNLKIARWLEKDICMTWRESEWAKPLFRGLDYASKLILAPKGVPDHQATINYWLHVDKNCLMDFKNILLAIDEDWAEPIQSRIIELMLKKKSKPEHQPP